MEFDAVYLVRQLPALWRGLLVTVGVSLVGMALSLVLGAVGAVVRHGRVPVLSPLIAGYVELVRNTPLLVQIFFVFYGLPTLGLTLSTFWSGALALTLWATAFQVENMRGALGTVPPGVLDAAAALGLRRLAALRLVTLPVALRAGLPPVLNTCVSLLKNSAYLQAIGLAELTYVAVDRIAADFRTLEMFSVLLVAYLGLVLLLSLAAGRIEARLSWPYVGT